MMGGFSYHRPSGHVIATFSGFEADLLRSLAGQLVELLRNEAAAPTETDDPLEAMLDFSGPTSEPEDPVLARLFPTAYRDDQDAAAEFRRFTEGSLREGKAAAAATIVDTLEEAGLPPEPDDDTLVIDVELDPPRAQAWLRSFTDIRLALATRLGVTEDDEDYWEQLDEENPSGQVYRIYQWVGVLQETLVDALWAESA
ncbi:MAG: DUF2017 domain-containing protein [Nocardioides sp.]|uniref:DUF2017 domain-containing protein n=1 Tax=Nocardioides sp. TaxID=35761 RepID=UPI0039E5478C